ncbi:hypothetical protein ANO11243_085610 [Dothideomycetidae sp. 11243]|nr:hypothetical protein ANO11243_085610 [fungal sp. No.11243]
MIIYGLGSNGSGQLGISHKDDVSSPTILPLPPSLRQQEIVNIAAGGNHTLFHFSSGIYAAGCNDDGRCAFGAAVRESTTLQPVVIPRSSASVLFCAATWSASIFVTDDGSVLSCGSGVAGELGLRAGRTTSPTPEVVMSLADLDVAVTQLSASMAHVVMVLSDGSVLAWGNGKLGQMGDPAQVVWSPRKIEVPFPVVRAACGKDFTCFLSDPARGEIIVIGLNKRDRFSIQSSIPRKFYSWRQVVASWGTIFVQDKSNRLQSFGRNDRGQLGPAGLPILARIAAGSEHALAETADGRTIVWGWGEHGNCGSPVDEQRDVKHRFNVLEITGNVVALGAGCATSFVVTDGD